MSTFIYPPSPQILQWLAGGQLANRLLRSLRLWVLLQRFYSSESPIRAILSQTFIYPELRDLLFAPTHPTSDLLTADQLLANCRDSSCICHQSSKELLFTPNTAQSESEWTKIVMQMTGIPKAELAKKLRERPFATVHRSIRDDLKKLVEQGWLRSPRRQYYQCIPSSKFPPPPTEIIPNQNGDELSKTQISEILQVLESIAFVQPNIEILIDSLRTQVSDRAISQTAQTPSKRIFIHLDYILSPDQQDQVDDYQAQLESLWHKHEGGVVQFPYWSVSQSQEILITVYPVCLHYIRRAKYLSAYGKDPKGKFGWHNYRLDRITSNQLKILAWGDPDVPKPLKNLWRSGQLPTPTTVQNELNEAWGFDFYRPAELFIVRFPTEFARWYVQDTFRHPTFQTIAHQNLPHLIREQIKDLQQQQQLLQIIAQKSEIDAYYQGWIRTGDVNVLMRLRDWRPNGEVIAPLSIRQLLQTEAAQELANYQSETKISISQ